MSTPVPVHKTRRTHTKSRGGCKECKRRKLKCNEEKPACIGCRKREIACEYPDIGPPRAPNFATNRGYLDPSRNASISNLVATPGVSSSNGLTPAPTSLPESQPVPAPSIGIFDMQDMALWHHFITSTAHTLPDPWHNELPRLSLTSDYLLHGILAIAALHLAYLDPTQAERFTYQATHHQDIAIPSFRQACANLTPKNANPCFAFSTLLLVFNFASYRASEHLLPVTANPSSSEASSWIACMRGCNCLIREARPYIENGPLGYLLKQGAQFAVALATGALPRPEDDKSLKQVTETVLNLPSVKSSTTVEEMESYRDAIARLRNLLAADTTDLTSVQRRVTASIWPCVITDTFVRLLSEKRPPALIIMAHYCILLKNVRDCWYMEYRAESLLQGVQKNLGAEWAGYVQHPSLVVNGRS